MKTKLKVEGIAQLVSVYESDDKDEKYFARVDMNIVNNRVDKDNNNHRRENSVIVDIPLFEEQYKYFRDYLKNQTKNITDTYNDPTDRRPFVKLNGNLELIVNPNYRATKIERMRTEFPYYVKQDEIDKATKKGEGKNGK